MYTKLGNQDANYKFGNYEGGSLIVTNVPTCWGASIMREAIHLWSRRYTGNLCTPVHFAVNFLKKNLLGFLAVGEEKVERRNEISELLFKNSYIGKSSQGSWCRPRLSMWKGP